MSNKSPFFNVVKNEAAREATIYIYGQIGGIDFDTWKEKNTAELFKDEFKAIEKDPDTIHVRINSPGGYVFEGVAIYNILFASDKKIITYNDGIAASMAALILLAGDEIHAFSNSLFMLHNASGMFMGNKKEVEDQMELLDTIDVSLGTAIEERLGITPEEVAENYLNYKDNWFTAKEAKEIGFYDKIIKKKKAKVPTDAMNMSPVQLMEKYAAMTFNIPTPEPKPENNMSTPNSFPNLEATLGLDAPLASTDNGSYLNEDQKAAIENKLSANATALKTAQDAQATAEAALQTAKEEHATELQAATGVSDNLTEQLRAAATLAGVEGLADDASAEDISTALTARIEELNARPGATHTSTASNDKDPGEYSHIDFNSSIYKNR